MEAAQRSAEYVFQGIMYYFRREKVCPRYQFTLKDPVDPAQRKTERMTEKLNLSEKQSKQLYEVNLQDIKEMQAQAEQMRAYRKTQAEKMKGILTPEQFEQWKQMQGPRHGMNRGPRMKDGRGDKAAVREGRKCAPCAGDRKCDGPRSGKEKK